MIEVLLNNEVEFDAPKSLETTVLAILSDHGIQRGELSLAIIDDQTMHTLNREHLQHDYPTDVLSFLLERTDDALDGEVIVSCETAARMAPDFGWSAQDELLLYFVHGCLHLVGYDDHSDEDRTAMRQQEAKYLVQADVSLPQGHGERVLLEEAKE